MKNKSKKWQKEHISIILYTSRHRLKRWSKNALHTLCSFLFPYSLENCARCFIALRPQCKTESRSPSLFTCYLFFRCRIEKESLSWAFPQHSPTHTHTLVFHRHISVLTHKHTFLTNGLSIFLEMLFTLHAWRDLSTEVVPGCPPFTHYIFQKTRL